MKIKFFSTLFIVSLAIFGLYTTNASAKSVTVNAIDRNLNSVKVVYNCSSYSCTLKTSKQALALKGTSKKSVQLKVLKYKKNTTLFIVLNKTNTSLKVSKVYTIKNKKFTKVNTEDLNFTANYSVLNVSGSGPHFVTINFKKYGEFDYMYDRKSNSIGIIG